MLSLIDLSKVVHKSWCLFNDSSTPHVSMLCLMERKEVLSSINFALNKPLISTYYWFISATLIWHCKPLWLWCFWWRNFSGESFLFLFGIFLRLDLSRQTVSPVWDPNPYTQFKCIGTSKYTFYPFFNPATNHNKSWHIFARINHNKSWNIFARQNFLDRMCSQGNCRVNMFCNQSV